MKRLRGKIETKESLIKKIYDEYYRPLCFYATKYIRDFENAKDIVQQVFVKLWELESINFENDYALSAYLYAAVYRSCLNVISKTKTHKNHHQIILNENSNIDNSNYLNERIESEVLWQIFQAIDSLPKECQRIFKMSYIEGLSVAQVAEMMNISEHTVKSQRARAKQLLAERLKNLYPLLTLLFLS